MAKFHGVIGYAETAETKPGVWFEEIYEREYTGDFMRNSRSLQNASQVNDNVNVSLQISIIADPYAMNNFHSIRYVTYMGARWKVTNIEVNYPRLILTVGGLYNGE